MELVKVNNLKKTFPKHKTRVLDDINLSIKRGEVLGLVGESGCGKSTMARAMLRLTEVQEGAVSYRGVDLLRISEKEMRATRRKLQIVFQDPFASLDPRFRVRDTIKEVFIIHGNVDNGRHEEKAVRLLEMVGLNRYYLNRLPSELSGGERQRVGIARALAGDPEFIICDEPVSSLDISVQAQILNLLIDLKKEKRLTYLFISHDPGVIAAICDRVAVMKEGRIVELGECEETFRNPGNEYTKKLLSAVC